MWVVRLAHPNVNKFRLIAEHRREAAEQKATDQMKAWDAEFEEIIAATKLLSSGLKHWQISKATKQLLSPERRMRQLAEQLTAQVQREIGALESLIRDAALVTRSITWGLSDCSPCPERPSLRGEAELVPPEPDRASYLPHLSVVNRAMPWVRNRKISEGEERYRCAFGQWQRRKSEIEVRNRERIEGYEREVAAWEQKKEEWFREQARLKTAAAEKREAYSRCTRNAVADYCRELLCDSAYPCVAAAVPSIATREAFSNSVVATEHPHTFPREFELDYEPETRTAVVDYELPRVEVMPSVKAYKYVAAGDRAVPVPMPRSSADGIYELVLYQVALRTIYELFRWDKAAALDSIVFNGWVNALDGATGLRTRTCILTVQAGNREFKEINLAAVDPKACFRKLKGISGAKLAGMSPVRPILKMNRDDKRFVSARPVMDALDNSTNLAAIDWEDFEQLIRDVFEKEFSGDGGEVKITRASRDHGVDAVAFDPDPIRGGKVVIQAKRYTDTVSVSAVRDLYGTIINEGANKGILVTTADYGPDAYEFAKGKPITLLNGSELLYLLQRHGRKARIDLAEARRLAAEQDKTAGR